MISLEDFLDLASLSSDAVMQNSSDGRWLSLTVRRYGTHAQPLSIRDRANGIGLMMLGVELLVIQIGTARVIKPFPDARVSWGGVWSPEGKRLAAYVQMPDQQACLGIWDSKTEQVQLFPGVEPKTTFEFEVPQRTPDGQALILKLSENNSRTAIARQPQGIRVFNSTPQQSQSSETSQELLEWMSGDLVELNLGTGTIRLLIPSCATRYWPVSPDGTEIVLFQLSKDDPSQHQALYQLVICSRSTRAPLRVIADHVPLSYSITLNWSPDGQWLAYTTTSTETDKALNQQGIGQLFVVLADGSAPPHALTQPQHCNPAQDFQAPRWSEDSKRLYAMTETGLWTGDLEGKVQHHFPIESSFQPWIQTPFSPIFQQLDGNCLELISQESSCQKMRILRLDLETGEVTAWISKAMYSGSNFSQVVAADGTHYFVTEHTNQPAQLWRRSPKHSEPQLLCNLNHRVKPELGNLLESVQWQNIKWRSPTGETLSGALMLSR